MLLYELTSKKITIPEKEYQLIKLFLIDLLYKKDGSRTKFAKKYNVKSFKDFYVIFKQIKQNLRNDREGFAFGIMKDMAKVYVGKVWNRMPGNTPEEKIFNAWSVALDRIALILDNLKILQSVLNRIDKEVSAGK